MVLERLSWLTPTRRDLILLLVASTRAVTGTMPQYNALTPHWWLMLAMNIIALPVGWVLIHHMTPALGHAIGTGLVILIIVAVPAAILALIAWHIIVSLIMESVPWVQLKTGAQVEPENTATYSVANLFSLAKVPHRLYALTCTLLLLD